MKTYLISVVPLVTAFAKFVIGGLVFAGVDAGSPGKLSGLLTDLRGESTESTLFSASITPPELLLRFLQI